MDARQFQRAIGTRNQKLENLNGDERNQYKLLITSEIQAYADAIYSRQSYLQTCWQEADNFQVTEDMCMVLGLVAEYFTFRGITLDDAMRKAIQMRSQRNNDISGVN